ncbi:ATP--cob(I)alamin adenosyltransferase [Halobacillus andaensis]|uniref:Corrinoid adenosyltransferase n=1 Tax=Halobacillus andaensis TaxID=1176239 RepID=A0A917EX42_HALAA|nr:cob(I)yrinic acid a,c-diamide adenosyltransferase [Halobacillus andaensis]MBP2005191.1 cob(I)alamin adenosyltransferase [Halobacillus andaensis]GGF29565.1 ATP--cob(I)alamin adenosyltransferase [Halobacillus andaensis]
MRLYTRTGDKGQTSVIGGRVEKDEVRVEAYGTVDEVNSFVGKARTELEGAKFTEIQEELERIQHELFDCGSDLANKKSNRPYKLQQESIDWLEQRMDEYIQKSPELERFILPGGSAASATLHIARTITRRAERLVVTLQKQEEIHPVCLIYLNRLSDYFFGLARYVNMLSEMKDVEYIRSAKVFRSGKRKENE